jgi:DNA-binding PadR family transcriptional regulator
MYELLVLSLLMHWPLHAYRIVKIANEIVGPEERISKGTLSALLARLERTGLIQPAAAASGPFPTDRPSRVFAITPAGRQRFLELMLDTTSHPGAYHLLFHIKALHLEFLPVEQQLPLVEHYLAHCRQMLHSKQSDESDVSENPLKQRHMGSPFRQAVLRFVRLKLDQWQLELAWAEALRTEIVAGLPRTKKEF